MAKYNADERLAHMIGIIESEAHDKANTIIEEANERCKVQKNRLFSTMREKLNNEYKKKLEGEEVRLKT